MSILTALTCMFGVGCAQSLVHWDTLGTVVMEATNQDGDMLIFNGRNNPGLTFSNIPTFIIGDEKLERFLDLEPDKAVVLEMYKDRSDFHVYDFNPKVRPPWGFKIPKEFKQPEGIHEKLNLEYADNIRNEKLQFTLVFDDSNKAIGLSNKMNALVEKFPNALFKCWDIIESDIGHHTFDYPSIVVSSLAHGDKIYDMKPPITNNTLEMFVRANVLKVKDYTVENIDITTEKKATNKEKTVYRSDL